MNENKKQQIKSAILEQLSLIEKDIELLEEATAPIAPDNAIGRLTRMDAINNKAVAEAALVDKRATFSNLKQALTKIDAADFGQCAHCGSEIAFERLMYLPHSPYCITCASQGRR
ncbi:MAG: TraR/DksA C4-type zinc finger protein [candidate division KSB1 bacterium]|nr:TraR/DksA C4-type zinc finger protein [candidate division KSB1 bacterium]